MRPAILFILHLPPPFHGAAMAGSYVQESETINQAFEANYINLSTAGSLSDIGKSGLKKNMLILKLWLRIIRALVGKRYQLCYLTINSKGAAWYKELVIVALVKLFHVPLVYHYHNKGVALNANNLFKKMLYRFQFNQSKSILLSPLLHRDIAQFANIANVEFCPNGIPDQVKSSLFIENGFPGKKLHNSVNILFLSNLIESKGVFILLEACALLRKRELSFNCIFAGGESDITSFQFDEMVKQLELSDQVTYQGKKYGEEKTKLFFEADIFAFPTYYHNECFPLVLLEAMQYSLPVVSTFEGAIPDMVEDTITGFLVPQRSAKDIADKLEIFIRNPELRKKMGNAGRKKYEENFTFEIFEKRMVSILSSSINQ